MCMICVMCMCTCMWVGTETGKREERQTNRRHLFIASTFLKNCNTNSFNRNAVGMYCMRGE